MPPKKRESKKTKHYKRITRLIVQPILIISFFLLVISAVTMVVRAFSTTTLAHDHGIPAIWEASSTELPDTITIPVTYYDQISEPCSVAAADRQFEFTRCNLTSSTVQPGIVKDTLGTDGLPVPSNIITNTSFLNTSWGVTGHDPVQPDDNFYRWFHQVEGKSLELTDRSITFNKIGEGLYQYGGSNVFPLDNIDFSKGDYDANRNHNYHFTTHFSAPFYVKAGGNEYFEFEGDDDVWVFVNGKLVLDIGGLHTSITGHFKINSNATITATVAGKSKTIDVGLKDGMKTTIDVFHAERSTTESNFKVTINGMLQPITATPNLTAKVVEDSLVEYVASITNSDPNNSIEVQAFSSFLSENNTDLGFLNLDNTNLSYSTAPTIPMDWPMLDINRPSDNDDGFALGENITLVPDETLYLHYFARPTESDGQLDSIVSFLVSRDTTTAIVSTNATIEYSGLDSTDDKDNDTTVPTTPPGDLIGDDIDDDISDLYEDPLGEMYIVRGLTAPNTGLANFASVILSQGYILAVLGVFAVSFTIYWPVRKY